MRNAIFFSKRDLKGSPISICEHLTPTTLELLSLTKTDLPDDIVYTNQCKVIVKRGTFKHRIKDVDDIEALKTGVSRRRRPPAEQRSTAPKSNAGKYFKQGHRNNNRPGFQPTGGPQAHYSGYHPPHGNGYQHHPQRWGNYDGYMSY